MADPQQGGDTGSVDHHKHHHKDHHPPPEEHHYYQEAREKGIEPPPPYSLDDEPADKEERESLERRRPGEEEDAGGGEEEEEDPEERGHWNNPLDFLMSCIGYAVGLGNIWRFPYLCYRNGGGAFLIPYLIFMVLVGLPLFFLEITLGQFLSLGAVSMWKICPIMKGIGYGSMTMAAFVCIYYCVIIAWAILYLFYSFTDELVWNTCTNPWNNISSCYSGGNLSLFPNLTNPNKTQAAVEQFWQNHVLGQSSGIDVPGTIRWDLAVSLLVGWLVVYFVIWKGLHSSGYVLWFTALFPYVILVALLGYGVSRPGAGDGIIYYLNPDFSRLQSSQVWLDAATQIMYSYGIGFGSLFALGSYNRYNNNCYKDALIVGCINSATSILGGFVIFSILGFMAQELGTSIDKVVDEGPGLAFLTYPQAVAMMPVAPLWSSLFFIMLLVLGIDSQFCMLEGLITGLCDDIPILRHNKKKFTIILCLVIILLELPLITEGGVYVFELINQFSAGGVTLLFIVFFESIALNWFFGTDKVYLALFDMIGIFPNFVWYYIWRFISPVLIFGAFVYSFVSYAPAKYGADYTYPWYGQMIAYVIALSSILWIPAYAIYYLVKLAPGRTWRQKLKSGITPQHDVKQLRNLTKGVRIRGHRITHVDLTVAALEPGDVALGKL